MDAAAARTEPADSFSKRWAADVVLTDGGTVHLRPVRPDDRTALATFFSHLSPDSIYMRFFTPRPTFLERDLRRFVEVDHDERVGLVAELGDEIVALAGYDRMPGRDEAEVAFLVADAHQGRGLGTLLLEHLAGIGRAMGIHHFAADVLGSNRRMLQVFRDAGFETESRFEQGVVRVAFSIEPTPESLEAAEHREHLAEARSMARLLAPRSVAVIGAGRQSSNVGHAIFQRLLEGDFAGPVYPVNPSALHVASVRAWPDVLEIPDDVDLAIVAVPARAVLEVVRHCARKRVRGLVVVSAGFAEAGHEGVATEAELVEIVRRNGMRMIGPNCLGIANTDPEVRLNATFAPRAPLPGRVALLSQSGALGIAVIEHARRLGLGLSHFVSVGNKADVSGNDLLQYWEDDARTDVVLLYLESFGNPRKFARLARRISRKKPIVAVKGGRTTAGTRAAQSHTAALASSDVIVDSLFLQTGVIRVDTLEQLFDVARVLDTQPLPAGRRVAIVGNSGGPGILAADACEGAGLDVPELAARTQQELRKLLGPAAAVRNPVDLLAAAPAEAYEKALRRVLADPSIDAVIAIFTPLPMSPAAEVHDAIARAARAARLKPFLACFLADERSPGPLAEAETGRGRPRAVPVFEYPEAAARALARAADYAAWRRRPEGSVPPLRGVDDAKARGRIEAALAETPEGGWLDAPAAQAVLAAYGIPVVPTRLAATPEEAAEAARELGLPAVVKLASGSVVHKTEARGVRLDLATLTAVRDATRELLERFPGPPGVLVQPMREGGVETLVGIVQDPSFGPLVAFGMGGVTAELLQDRVLRVVPLTDRDVREAVRAIRGAPLLFGFRGAPPVDVAALEDLLLRVGRLAEDLPEVAEMDMNPVRVSERGVETLDVRVRLAPAGPRPDLALRRLRSPGPSGGEER